MVVVAVAVAIVSVVYAVESAFRLVRLAKILGGIMGLPGLFWFVGHHNRGKAFQFSFNCLFLFFPWVCRAHVCTIKILIPATVQWVVPWQMICFQGRKNMLEVLPGVRVFCWRWVSWGISCLGTG